MFKCFNCNPIHNMGASLPENSINKPAIYHLLNITVNIYLTILIPRDNTFNIKY